MIQARNPLIDPRNEDIVQSGKTGWQRYVLFADDKEVQFYSIAPNGSGRTSVTHTLNAWRNWCFEHRAIVVFGSGTKGEKA